LKTPCTESYLKRWAKVFVSVRSLMATTSMPSLCRHALKRSFLSCRSRLWQLLP
jgi:hypothetical protein